MKIALIIYALTVLLAYGRCLHVAAWYGRKLTTTSAAEAFGVALVWPVVLAIEIYWSIRHYS